MTGIVRPRRGLSLCQLGYALFYCHENGLSLYLSLFPGFDDRLCRRLRLRFSGATPENRFASLKAPVERSRVRARPISLQTWLLSRCLKVRTATNHFVTVLPRSLPPLFLSSLLSAFWRARVCASIGWDFVASLG